MALQRTCKIMYICEIFQHKQHCNIYSLNHSYIWQFHCCSRKKTNKNENVYLVSTAWLYASEYFIVSHIQLNLNLNCNRLIWKYKLKKKHFMRLCWGDLVLKQRILKYLKTCLFTWTGFLIDACYYFLF